MPTPSVVLLAGGLGGSRMAAGLQHLGVLERSLVVVNVADDLEVDGLPVSPDIDTILYALADRLDTARGWGLRDDTFTVMDALAELAGPQWFRLGDRDLATHLFRARCRAKGLPLSAAVRRLSTALGVPPVVTPVTDAPVRTRVETEDDEVDFQTYHVRLRAGPRVVGVTYAGVASAPPAPGVAAGLRDAGLVLIAPSSPVASILPQLAVPGVRSALIDRQGPTVAVSPVVLGLPPDAAVQHRARTRAQLLAALGVPHTPAAVAGLYTDLVDAFVVDEVDAATQLPLLPAGVTALVGRTVCRDAPSAAALLSNLLRWAS